MKIIKNIEAYIQRLDFENKITIQHHLTLCAKHVKKGRWDDSCSQLRKVLEQIFFDIATTTADVNKEGIPHKHISIQNHEILEYLKNKQFISPYEVSHLNSFYALLSDKSSHPGIPKKEEALNKINICFQILNSDLKKYEIWIKNGYKFIPDSLPESNYQVIDALKKSLLQKVAISEHYIPTITLTPNNMNVAYKAKSKEDFEKAPVRAKISVFAKAKEKLEKALRGWESVEFDETELANVELFVGKNLVLPKKEGEKMKLVISPNIPEKPMRIFIPETDIGFDYVLMRLEKIDNNVLYFNAKSKDDVYNFKLGYPTKDADKGSFGLTIDTDIANICQFVKYEDFLRGLYKKREIAIKSLELDKVIFKAQVDIEKEILLSQEQFTLYEDLCLIQQKTNMEIKMPKEITERDIAAIYKIKNALINRKEERPVNNMRFKLTKTEILKSIDRFSGEISNVTFRMPEIYHESLLNLQIPLGKIEIIFKRSILSKSIEEIKKELEQYSENDLYELTLIPLPKNQKNAEFRYIE